MFILSSLTNFPLRQKGGGLTPSKQPKTWREGLAPRVLRRAVELGALRWVGCGRWVAPRTGRRAWGGEARRGTEARVPTGLGLGEGQGPARGDWGAAPAVDGRRTEASAQRPAEASFWAGARRAAAGALCPSHYFQKKNSP